MCNRALLVGRTAHVAGEDTAQTCGQDGKHAMLFAACIGNHIEVSIGDLRRARASLRVYVACLGVLTTLTCTMN